MLDSPILLGRLIGYLKTNDYYAKRTVEYLKTSFKVTNKVKKNNNKKQIPISRYVIKLTNDFFANFHREYEKVLKSKQKETKGASKADPLADLGDVSGMTVEEIATAIDKTARGVKTMLTRRGLVAADYDGASKKEKATA